jgi:hypothetical protein
MESAGWRDFMRLSKAGSWQKGTGGYNPSRCQIVVVSPAWFMV